MTTRETLLALFEKNKGFYISGEYIAQNLGVSRTAVWKAVKKLQKERSKNLSAHKKESEIDVENLTPQLNLF